MVYCLSRSQPPFFESAWRTSDGPDRPVVIEKNRWAERESNPHSQRRLIDSQDRGHVERGSNFLTISKIAADVTSNLQKGQLPILFSTEQKADLSALSR